MILYNRKIPENRQAYEQESCIAHYEMNMLLLPVLPSCCGTLPLIILFELFLYRVIDNLLLEDYLNDIHQLLRRLLNKL
jgi:hypothetical protein